VNGAQLAILNHRVQGIARKMANTLLRTGRSGVLNRARDFSCCIVTADCQLLAAAESLPIHVLSGPDLMARSMLDFHPDLQPGDAFLNNSPYHGCSHAADHTILVPVFDNVGRHRFTMVAKAHQADIGNSIPTTYHGTARDVYEEGALIFPSVQIERDYKAIEDVVRMCRMRIRVPDQWWGDFLAMVGAARIGEREMRALGAELGWHALDQFTGEWFDYSDRLMRLAIKQMPAGTVSGASTHDEIPGTPQGGITIRATVEVDPEAAKITVDLTNNPDSLPCGLNLSEACAHTAALIGVFNSIDHHVPKCAGSFRRVDVKLREGCVVGIPRHPTSCSVATTNLADRVASAVQSALAEIDGPYGMAEGGAVLPPSTGVLSGVDPDTGEPFVNQIFLGATGGPGAPKADAWLTLCHVGNGGLCYLDSVELDELYMPLEVTTRRIVPDTEGAGEHRGAPSLEVEFGPVGCDIEIGFVADGVVNAAKGVRGGLPGGPGSQWRRTVDKRLEPLEQCGQFVLRDGERVVSISTGGGGYGRPTDRDPKLTTKDLAEGWITPERAHEVYGLKAPLELPAKLR
jgi:N-methylhydantoinase B